MRLPGFTAEASLHQIGARYTGFPNAASGSRAGSVEAQFVSLGVAELVAWGLAMVLEMATRWV